MLAVLSQKISRLADSRHAYSGLFFYAFTEAVIFLVPADVLLASLTLANPAKGQRFALIAACGSVLGACLIYAVGFYGFKPLALPILELLCPYFDMACPINFIPKAETLFAAYGFWVITISIFFSIIPRRLIALVAGLSHMWLPMFILASLLGRWLRYALVALFVKTYGHRAKGLWQKNLPLALALTGFVLFIILLISIYS